MVDKLLYFMLFFCTIMGHAQRRTAFAGKVMAGQEGVKNVFVINKKTGSESKTDISGDFSVDVQVGDIIVIYNAKIQERQFTINTELLKVRPFIVQVSQEALEMDELVINKYGRVDEVSLGLVPANQKRYTVAERRLRFAMGGGMPVIYLINLMNGEIAKAKRAVRTEKKVMMIESLQGMYNEDEIMQMFGIPQENVSGFFYYLSEDKEFALLVKQGRKPNIDFQMLNYAKEYIALLKDAE